MELFVDFNEFKNHGLYLISVVDLIYAKWTPVSCSHKLIWDK